MAVDTPSMFAQVIQDHLELKRRNAALEHEMPLDKYMNDDPFENHPLFKTEEQARIEETMDGVQGIEAEETSLDWPTTEDTFIDEPAAAARLGGDRGGSHGGAGRSRAALRREPLVALPRLRLGRLAQHESDSARRIRFASVQGRLSLAQTLSSMRFIGQNVAEPPKSSVPAANTFAPAGVS